MENPKFNFLGTLEQLWINVELPIRANANIPNEQGTLNWGMSGEGESPVVLPRATTTEGIYAIPVPERSWNGITVEQLLSGVTHPQTEEYEGLFPEEQ